MPCAAANPAGSSKTYRAGDDGEKTFGYVSGATLLATVITLPSASAHTMSIGNRISFIHMFHSPSVSNTNSIPFPSGRSDLPESPRSRRTSVSATSTARETPPIVIVRIMVVSTSFDNAAYASTATATKTSTANKYFFILAEAERFELSIPCGMPPFQGGALDHYATPPCLTTYNKKSPPPNY